MKTSVTKPKRQGGFMVIALVTIAGIMSLYVASNLATLAVLKSDLRLIEQKHLQHWRR